MRVRVKLFGALRKHLPAGAVGGVELELSDGATVADVLAELGIPIEHAGMVVSNDEQLEKTAGVRDGQELSVFAPLAGGA
jgi:molybdopterin converting factor small subunit